MTTFYLDFEGGNDSNAGTSFALRWKSLTNGATAARLTAGDTVRVMASKDPTLVQSSVSWTNNSPTVTLASAVTVGVDFCDAAWTASTNVTATVDASTYKEGSGCANLAIAAAFTTGLAAYMKRVDYSAAVGAHRYWRVNVTAGVGRNYIGCAELQLRTVSGGSNVASGGTASASSTFSTQTASLAFDGNSSTFWASNNGTMPEWLEYDFGAGVTKEIVEIAWMPRQDSFAQSDSPASAAVQYSDDGTTWNTSWVYSSPGLASGAGSMVFTKPSVATTPIDLSAYQQVSLWVRSDTAVAASALSLRLCSDAAGATTVNTISLPAIPAINEWQCVTVDTGAALGTNINSVALYCDSDLSTTAAVNVKLDCIIACKASSSADSLTLSSLISKGGAVPWAASTTYAVGDMRRPSAVSGRNGLYFKATAITTGTSGSTEPAWPDAIGATVVDSGVTWTAQGVEETWYPIRSISSTTITLDNATTVSMGTTASKGYQGATESVPTFKREPIQLAPTASTTTASQTINKTGTAAAPITFSGGWDRTAMSSQTGDTFVSGQNSYGVAFSSNLQIRYWEFINFGATRFYQAWTPSENLNGWFKLTNCQASAMANVAINTVNGPLRMQMRNVQTFGCQYGTQTTGSSAYDLRRVRLEGNTNSGIAPAGSGMLRIEDGYMRGNGTFGVEGNSFNPFQVTTLLGCLMANNATADVRDAFGCIKMHNCQLASTTPLAAQNNGAYTYSGKNGQVAGAHLITSAVGTIASDSSQRHTASGISWKFSPTSTLCDQYGPLVIPIAKVGCVANASVTISVWTRRDNTNVQGMLRVRGGQVAGVGESTVSCAPTINTWTQSSNLVITPTEDGVVEVEFVVWDGTGTANNFWIDDLSVA